ncbi:NAD-dependent protein deacetylase sirtuin-3 [Blattella germanica]|nr:NAD-dependent protein deacetylase sirtuin-3 [Blattella germanica]
MNLVRNKSFWRKSFRIVRCFSSDGLLPTETLQGFADHLKEKCDNVLVMAGAGLSTPSGIPDFRELYPGGKYHPNLGHHFVHLLHHKGKLLRMYTQNIDGLERLIINVTNLFCLPVSGIPGELLVEAHGGFNTASCIRCFKKHDPDKTRELILQGETVRCDRSFCKGLVKPDIVFFGEALPDRFFLYEIDTIHADCLIVIGTSLEDSIPRILLNRDVVGSFGFRGKDLVMQGDIIESVKSLATALGWMDDLEEVAKMYLQKNPVSGG